MNWKIPLFDISLTKTDKDAVTRVLESGWLTMGNETARFEAEFQTFTGIDHAVAVCNCTAALDLSLGVLGIGQGDEIICPALNFCAGPNVIIHKGADVVFADISSQDDLCICPEDVESKITSRTRALMVMHYAGHPCDMEALNRIARNHNLYIIEDAAHAVGACLNGVHCGAMSDLGCFSFYSNKNMTTGEGGMVAVGNPELDRKLRLLRSHGMTSSTMNRHMGQGFSYDLDIPGFNYRMDEMRAALGRSQLTGLDKANLDRKALAKQYRKNLADTPVRLPFDEPRGNGAYHIQPVLLPKGTDRSEFMTALRARGIQTSIHYPPVHLFNWYRKQYPHTRLPVTESIAPRLVTLPLYAGMGADKVDFVCQAVMTYFKTKKGC